MFFGKGHFLSAHRIPAAYFVIALSLGLASADTSDGSFIQNPDFTSVTYSGNKAVTTLYGQFGSGTGSTLVVSGWDTSGYNFVFAPGTADAGDLNGAGAGQPQEAPGQYTASNGYGNTFLWGANNGGLVTLPATCPAGGNFIAADGVFQVGAITQTLTGLTIGNQYQLTFYWAAAQQQGYTGATTENWKVALGTESYTTSTYSLPAKSFSGWMQQTFTYTATSTSDTLSFLAQGTPSGQPPFVLLGGLDFQGVPEVTHWAIYVGFLALIVGTELFRRRSTRHIADKG